MYLFQNAPLVVTLTFFILGNVPHNNNFVHAIFDGIEAKMGTIPWQVYFRVGWNYHCAGTYTEVTVGDKTDYVILTTATCLTYRERHINMTHDPFFVHGCGETNLFIDNRDNPWAPQRDARKLLVHEHWNPDTLENDIGIIFMKRQWTISRDIIPIKLPEPHEQDPLEGQISGWGARGSSSQLARELRWRWVVLPSEEYCLAQSQPPRIITNKQLCLSPGANFTGVTTCLTDRGGPFAYYSLTNGWRLGGIISYQMGTPCRERTLPTVLTKISAYVGWIKSAVIADGIYT